MIFDYRYIFLDNEAILLKLTFGSNGDIYEIRPVGAVRDNQFCINQGSHYFVDNYLRYIGSLANDTFFDKSLYEKHVHGDIKSLFRTAEPIHTTLNHIKAKQELLAFFDTKKDIIEQASFDIPKEERSTDPLPGLEWDIL